MKFASALCLLTSTTFLIACEPVDQCSWSAPITFTEDTKQWLGGLDWPEAAYADFNQIGDHNELYGRYCN